MANGQQPTIYQYDPASRLTRVAQGALAVGLGYDNANRRTSLTYPNSTSTSYIYDVASRLTNINHIGPSGIIEALTYSYDAAGNRFGVNRANGTASLLPNAVASATYDAANEQTAFAEATLTYDANGNLTNDGTNTYVWDARNRLVGITGGTTAVFSYDSLGRRVSKTINGVVSQSLYDGNDIAAEIGGGAVGANYLRSLNIDEPFILQTSAGNEHYHTDALGSSLALSNASSGSVAAYGYEPFGKTTTAGSSTNALQYTGREEDGTGLYYYRARYYHPRLQRFISEDPIGFGGGDANLYLYVQNAPANLIDPLGLRFVLPPRWFPNPRPTPLRGNPRQTEPYKDPRPPVQQPEPQIVRPDPRYPVSPDQTIGRSTSGGGRPHGDHPHDFGCAAPDCFGGGMPALPPTGEPRHPDTSDNPGFPLGGRKDVLTPQEPDWCPARYECT